MEQPVPLKDRGRFSTPPFDFLTLSTFETWSGHDVVYLTSLSLRGPGPKLDSWWAIHYAPICSIWVHINCPGLMFFSQSCSKKTYKSTGLGAVKLSVARVCWASRGCDWPAKNQFSPLKIICVFPTFFFFRGSGAKRIAILSSVCLFWLIEPLERVTQS